jgi:hypothetical protein
MTDTPPVPSPEEQPRLPVTQLSRIIAQIEDLVNIAIECENREPKPEASFADAFKRLQGLQERIQEFHDASLDAAKSLGLTDKDLELSPEKLEQFSPEERRVVLRLDELIKRCEAEREKMYISIRKSNKAEVKEAKEKLRGEEKPPKSRRKGKFKYLGGGDSGWLHT